MLPAVAIDALVDYATEACAAEVVEVAALGITPAALSEADAVAWQGDPCGRHPTLRAVLLRDGVAVARLTVRPSLTGHQRGPVAATDLSVGDAVAWVQGEVPLGVEVVDLPSGLVTRSLRAGDPLVPTSLRPAPDASEGSEVTVVVARGSVALTVPGTLLRDARLGEPARVRNDVNHVALTGVLTAPDRVEIR